MNLEGHSDLRSSKSICAIKSYWLKGLLNLWEFSVLDIAELCNKFDTEFCNYFRIPQWINRKEISPLKRITLAFLKTFKFSVQIPKQSKKLPFYMWLLSTDMHISLAIVQNGSLKWKLLQWFTGKNNWI